jgi:hypothetical protein
VRGALQRDVCLLPGLCDFARLGVIVGARCNDRITVFGASGHAPGSLPGPRGAEGAVVGAAAKIGSLDAGRRGQGGGTGRMLLTGGRIRLGTTRRAAEPSCGEGGGLVGAE